MKEFIIIYALISMIAFIGNYKEISKSDGWFGAVYLSVFPIVNIFVALMGIPNIIRKLIQPLPFCFGLHKGPIIYNSEQEKWRDGRRPLRVSVGGHKRHKCKKCGTEWNEYWRVF